MRFLFVLVLLLVAVTARLVPEYAPNNEHANPRLARETPKPVGSSNHANLTRSRMGSMSN
jgi:hypothetical protein